MSSADPSAREFIVPVHAEDVTITRRIVQGDVVRVSVVTSEHEQLIDEPVFHDRAEIEHVPVNRPVDAVPEMRQEGDVTIIPVVEEIIVTQRRLVLKEEIHIRRVRVEDRHREQVTLRRQQAVITRAPPGGPTTPEHSQTSTTEGDQQWLKKP
jgi:uncharacterized protein (TIGR02271 family)